METAIGVFYDEMQPIEKNGGPERDRTAGLLVANDALNALTFLRINMLQTQTPS